MLPLRTATLLLSILVTFSLRAAPAKPNIVLFLCDDLGYAEVGCYGQEKIKTPNVDKLAAEGMRFTQFYAGSTVCAPSRCTLMTGLHTGHTIVRDNKEIKPEGQWPLHADTYTIGKLLQDAGYTTACVGKWGLGGPGSTGEPNSHGFDHFFGHLCQRVAHNHYTDHVWRDTTRVDLDGKTYAPDLMADDAIQFIREQHEKHPDKPFFLYFATPLPHVSLQVPEDSMEPYVGKLQSEKPFVQTKSGGYSSQATPHAAYAAMVTRLDSHLGRIMATLKELNLDDNTLVIFTSDNGPTIRVGGADSRFFHSSGPFRGLKEDLYEGGIRIPCIARWPGHVAANSTNDHVAAFWDFMPTFADIVGVPAPKNIDGVTFAPTLFAKGQQPEHAYLYWEYHGKGGSQAVRMGNWKAIRNKLRGHYDDAPVELYDLAKDPGESHDLAADHPDIAAKMLQIMKSSRVPSENPNWNFVAMPKSATAPAK
jgi:arylsulfatase A-like enzyme